MVLHKNKWDKKASKNHEKKLSQKNSKAAAEEKEKTLARAAARENSRTNHVTAATSAATAPSSKSLTSGGGAGVETATATAGAGDGEAREVDVTSQSDSDDELDDAQGTPRYSRRKKVASNAWRYEEPEPIPGEEPEDVEPEPDYASLTKEKLKAIEEREQEREEVIDIRDRESVIQKFGQSNDLDFGPKGNVVKVKRDEFKDVTEKMAKQATADRFRQRFASRKTNAKSKEGDADFEDHESELDALIGNMDVKEKQTVQPTTATKLPKNTASPMETKKDLSKTKNTQHLDDDWLDDMLR